MGEGLKRAFAAARATQKPTVKRTTMKKWRVYGKIVASKYLGEFEAETKEEAERLALESDAAMVCFCHACAKEARDAEIASADAEPAD